MFWWNKMHLKAWTRKAIKRIGSKSHFSEIRGREKHETVMAKKLNVIKSHFIGIRDTEKAWNCYGEKAKKLVLNWKDEKVKYMRVISISEAKRVKMSHFVEIWVTMNCYGKKKWKDSNSHFNNIRSTEKGETAKAEKRTVWIVLVKSDALININR